MALLPQEMAAMMVFPAVLFEEKEAVVVSDVPALWT